MKILQVCPRYPPHTGGVELHVESLSRRLVDRGHEVAVHTADAGPRREGRDGVTINRHHGIAPGGAFHISPGIAAAVRRADADVVHAHNYHSLPVAFAALGVGANRFVVTPHYHGASAHLVRDWLLSVYRPIGRWALRRADAVIAVSEWERDRLDADFGIESAVVPNGVDIERFSGAEPVERDRPYLLSVGRLEQYKGIQFLIEALDRLPGYNLVVVGDGTYRSALEGIAESRGVSNRVEFCGHVEADDLPGLYAGAAVYVTLSSFESYGRTVAEALASGTPCVVRRAGGLESWEGEPGTVMVDTVDPKAVCGAVRVASRQSPTGTGVPSWSDVVDRIEAIYRG